MAEFLGNGGRPRLVRSACTRLIKRIARTLLSTVGLAALVFASSKADSAPEPNEPVAQSIEQRVQAIRTLIATVPPPGDIQEEMPADQDRANQWPNWPNWNNWRNWPNWPNWNNWNNWANGWFNG
jgi:hypothetical protein